VYPHLLPCAEDIAPNGCHGNQALAAGRVRPVRCQIVDVGVRPVRRAEEVCLAPIP
jgi:hypothetical protein